MGNTEWENGKYRMRDAGNAEGKPKGCTLDTLDDPQPITSTKNSDLVSDLVLGQAQVGMEGDIPAVDHREVRAAMQPNPCTMSKTDFSHTCIWVGFNRCWVGFNRGLGWFQ